MSFPEVEAAKLKVSEFAPNLTARILTCPADSSPETYSTLWPLAIFAQICIKIVDLPMPGCPAKRITEPRKTPPPSTSFRESNSVFNRSFSSEAAISLILEKLKVLPLLLACARANLPALELSSTTKSSTMVFHASQLLQWPAHLL